MKQATCMRVTATSAMNFGSAEGRAPQDTAESRPKAEGRALVLVEQPPAREDRPLAYRSAPFLAHLIATKAQLPQTRAKRRIEPTEAMAAYRSVAALIRR
jgi:hypothetical protein